MRSAELDRVIDDATKDAMIVDPANPPEFVARAKELDRS